MAILDLVDCDRIPGAAGMTLRSCRTMYLSAEKQSQIVSRQRFSKGCHPVHDGPLQWCVGCTEGESRAREMSPVEKGKEEELLKPMIEVQQVGPSGDQEPVDHWKSGVDNRGTMESGKTDDPSPKGAMDLSLRKCKKCGETKPLARFAISKNCKGGHEYGCKDCRKKAGKKPWNWKKAISKEEKKAAAIAFGYSRPLVGSPLFESMEAAKKSSSENIYLPPVLQLTFLESDRGLFDRLVEFARIERRTPEQQILWILENNQALR